MKIRLPGRFSLLFFLLFSIANASFSQSSDSVIVIQDSVSSTVLEYSTHESDSSIITLQDSVSFCLDTSGYLSGDISFNLIIAAEKGYEEEVLKLLNDGAKINIRTGDGVTALMYAVQNNHPDVVKILLLNGADPDIKPYNGPPALIVASGNSNPDIAELLIRKDADINIQDNNGRTALMHATAYGNNNIVDLFLYYEASVNLSDNSGITALMIACYYGHSIIIKLLIDNKATLEKEDLNGFTALHYATQNNHKETVDLLVSHGINIEKKNNAGYSALSVAVVNNNNGLTNYFLQNGADINSKISIACKPLNIARKNKNDSIIHFLEENGAKKSFFPSIDYGSINVDFSISQHDFLIGGGFGLHDSKYNISMNLGFATRITASEILEGADDDIYFQYWERRSYLYIGLTKRIPVYSWLKDHWLGFGLGAQLLYTFGSYRGATEKPDNKFLFSPHALIYTRINHFGISFKYEYVNFKVKGLSPHRFIIGLYFLIPGKRIGEPISKEILY